MSRRFVPCLAKIASPLSRHHKKTQAKDLGTVEEKELQTLDTLKEKFTSPQVRSLQEQNRHYTLGTGSCDKKIGWILLHEQEDRKTLGRWGTAHERLPNRKETEITRIANVLQ